MRFGLLLLVVLAASAGACTNEPSFTAESGAVDRSKLCKDGGAELNAQTNECVCPTASAWNGNRCEAPGNVASKTPEPLTPRTDAPPPASDGPGIALTQQPAPAVAAPEPAPAPTADAQPDLRLQQACRRAKGHWLAKDAYCLCPSQQVLVGSKCRKLAGSVTDDVCRGAVHKGKWKDGRCGCAAGQVFSPARGGCVAHGKSEAATLRRTCESSLNNGKWDGKNERCNCPAGRVWADELCQVQQDLPSAVVCESDYNQGKWDAGTKTCACRAGFFWHSQACKPLAQVADKDACKAEQNKGTWNDGLSKCICPGLGKWSAAEKRCR